MFIKNNYESSLQKNSNQEHSELDLFLLGESFDHLFPWLHSFCKSMNMVHSYKFVCNFLISEGNHKIATKLLAKQLHK